MEKWKLLQSQYVLQTPYMQVRRDACKLPSGITIDDYYVVEERDVGMVVGITPQQEILMVQQYKHGIQKVCLELPGGLFEGVNRENAHLEAQREFREETGYDAQEYNLLGSLIANPSRNTHMIHIFLALDVFPVGEQNLDTTEAIQVQKIPFVETFDLIQKGVIQAVDTVAGIFLAQAHMNS